MYEWILVNGENAVKEHLFLYTSAPQPVCREAILGVPGIITF